jgi:putative heme-binding domain-containing protein
MSPAPSSSCLFAGLGALCLLAGLSTPAAGQQLPISDHPGVYTQEEIAAGNRVYNAQCFFCHGRDGDQVSGVDLRRGVFRRSSSDEGLARLITQGTPGGMPPFKLDPSDLLGIVAYIRAGFDATASVRAGDASRGRAVFDGKGECGSCHRVAGRGPRTAPDLSDIGLARSPAALERSVRDPSSAMIPINRPVRLVLHDGTTIEGRRLNEDTYTVQLIDAQERLRSIAKSDVRTFEIGTRSSMPAYGERLTEDEIADVVAYLLTLREP